MIDNKHRKTLESIFEKPERANILWRDIEAMLITLGAEISEGCSSSVERCARGISSPTPAQRNQ